LGPAFLHFSISIRPLPYKKGKEGGKKERSVRKEEREKKLRISLLFPSISIHFTARRRKRRIKRRKRKKVAGEGKKKKEKRDEGEKGPALPRLDLILIISSSDRTQEGEIGGRKGKKLSPKKKGKKKKERGRTRT